MLLFLFRLQRTNKEGTSGGGLRYSPVHADHSVLAPTPVHLRHPCPPTCKWWVPCHLHPTAAQAAASSRLRSSVEGLNQEIERLVLRPSQMPGDDLDDVWSEVGVTARRAPIAEYLRFTRSVDTQTPARGSAVSAASSDHTSPSLSPPTPPPHNLDGDAITTPSPTSTQTLVGGNKTESGRLSGPRSFTLPPEGSAFWPPDRIGAEDVEPLPPTHVSSN
ncbi:Protein FAM117B [Chionoecetes opilio]|uniref:Protein FAM117B n=1 Tax=Chionoecetes opilio TaxID=41210 RepID=A0A8J4Y3U3_CHIOP|nr:Protein FAM117B [Chionoecetes opilio]